ncbi:hypothetical protein FRB99_005722 [Tulasnella sp. 403]|nr:hypothetical protein FRB99_005722 [Tulasnella sp. 403]
MLPYAEQTGFATLGEKTSSETPVRVTSPENSPTVEVETAPESPSPPLITLDLSHFAYVPEVGPLGPRAVSVRSISTDTAPGPERPLAKLPPRRETTKKRNQAFLAELAGKGQRELDIAPLATCPSCLVTWTSRKSVTAKVQHIGRCRKKSGLSAENMLLKIEELLASPDAFLLPARRLKEKGKSKATVQTTVSKKPNTYLADVVDNAGPKKRRRRHADPEPITVKPITETCDSIIDRARKLLDDQRDSLSSAHSKAALPNEVAVEVPLPTQRFSGSKLAALYRRSPSLGSENPSDTGSGSMDGGSKPATGSKRTNAFSFFDQYDSPPRKTLPAAKLVETYVSSRDNSPVQNDRILSKKSTLESPILISDDDSPKAASSHPVLPPRQKQDLASSANPGLEHSKPEDGGWSDDDACLVWDGQEGPSHIRIRDPDAKLGTQDTLSYLQQWDSGSSDSAPNNHQNDPTLPSTPRRPTVGDKPISTPRKKSQPRAKSKAHSTIPTKQQQGKGQDKDENDAENSNVADEELYERLKSMILEDEVLHSRILRLEPIHLDDFVEKANGQGLGSRFLRGKLKLFLDAACVIWHENPR